MALKDKLLKVGAVKAKSISDSEFFTESDIVTTYIPALNIALSGSATGGLTSGITILSGPSKHFKSNIGLMCVKSYLDRHEDAICLFYDSEFGIPESYFQAHGIDTSTGRVIHVEVTDLEQLKSDLTIRLEAIERGDKVIIFVDSISSLASIKEINDAKEEKQSADMTRAKTAKSLFRIITPKIMQKNIPCVMIAHTYGTMEMHSRQVVSGGTGLIYSANTVIILGRQQEKDTGGVVSGYNFIMNIEKSRYVKEKSKIPLYVDFNKGINRYSGILEMALDAGLVAKPSQGWYQMVDPVSGELVGQKVRASATETREFLGKILLSDKFREYVENTYRLGKASLNQYDDDVEDFEKTLEREAE